MALLSTFNVLVLILALLNSGMVNAAADADSPPTANESEVLVPSNANAEKTADQKSETCPKQFSCGDFFNACVDLDKVCDGHEDCSNGADEKDCNQDLALPGSEDYMESEYLFCKDNEFRCPSDGTCISKKKLCDGTNDCSNGEDEGGQCGTCVHHGCTYGCQENPTGPECYCAENMSLDLDGRTCTHVDICNKHGHTCSQFCEPSMDKLICKCAAGFDLKDETECVVKEQFRNGNLFVTKGDHTIIRVPLFKSNDPLKDMPAEVVNRPSNENITSIAFNPKNGSIIFVTNAHRNSTIMSIPVNSTNGEAKTIYEGHGIKHIAYDWIADNIYYAADGLGIGVCNGNGRFCSHLITGRSYHKNERVQTYGNLLVHPKMGVIIYVDFNSEHPGGAIMKASMDGKEVSQIGGLPTRPILMISLDYVRDELYILEGEELSVLNLHTLHRRSLASSIHPWAMIHFNGQMHYIARENGDLMVATGKTIETQRALDGNQFAMSIDNVLYYDHVPNLCDKKCPHMCVLNRPKLDKPIEGKCICPDKYSMQQDGLCVFNKTNDGPVRTSGIIMSEWCDKGHACGPASGERGTCKATGYSDHIEHKTTPACDCRPDHSGLYCEIIPEQSIVQAATSNKTVSIILFLLFASLLIPLVFYLVRSNPEWLDNLRTYMGIQPSSYPIIPTFMNKRGSPNGVQDQNEAILIQTA